MEHDTDRFYKIIDSDFISEVCRRCKYFRFYHDGLLYCKKHCGGAFSISVYDTKSFSCGRYKPNKQTLEEFNKFKKELKKENKKR